MITTEDSLSFKLECEQEKSKNLFEELMEYKNKVAQLEAELVEARKDVERKTVAQQAIDAAIKEQGK